MICRRGSYANCGITISPSLNVMGKVRDGTGGARWTPRAIAPMKAIMRMSFQNVVIHTRKGGDLKGSDVVGPTDVFEDRTFSRRGDIRSRDCVLKELCARRTSGREIVCEGFRPAPVGQRGSLKNTGIVARSLNRRSVHPISSRRDVTG
jgi:hypothetical protein